MVLNITFYSEQEGSDILKSYEMEKTVVNKPEESLTSKTSDNSLEAEFTPQTVITWMIISVAIGMVTIYNMLQLISNKVTKDNGKKTERHIEKQHKTNIYIPNQVYNIDNKEATYLHQDKAALLQTCEENENRSKTLGGGCEGKSLEMNENNNNVLVNKTYIDPEDGFISQEKCDSTILGTSGSGDVVKLKTEVSGCGEYQSTGHGTSINVGAGFSGNLSITTDSRTTECTVEGHSSVIKHAGDETLPSTISSVTTKVQCFKCDMSNANQQLSLEQDFCNRNKPNTYSPSVLSSDDCSNSWRSPKVEIVKSEITLKNGDEDNSKLLLETQSNRSIEDKSVKKVDDHKLLETTDGLVLPKNVSQDQVVSPQENEEETQAINCSKTEVEPLETPRSEFLRKIRDDAFLSNSLDSQIEVLQKGRKLLEKKPKKSALKSARSEGSLEKFVHFPEDIRNIRTVHKYDRIVGVEYADVQDPAWKTDEKKIS